MRFLKGEGWLANPIVGATRELILDKKPEWRNHQYIGPPVKSL
jgi:hypothetical protein